MDSGAPEIEKSAATGVSRRTMVKSAAWAVPVIALAAPTPAMAASPIPPNGLEGWVELSLASRDGNTAQYRIRGENDYPNFYLRVTQTLATQMVTSVYIVFLINRNIPNAAWSRISGDAGTWSLPVQGGTENLNTPGGTQQFWQYTITYLGGVSGFPAPPFTASAGFTPIDNRMSFTTTDSVSDSSTVYTYARRYVLMGGSPLPVPNPVWFQRGPVGLS